MGFRRPAAPDSALKLANQEGSNDECPACGSDKLREVFTVISPHEPLKLMRRCTECHHEREVVFAGNAKWLFLPRDGTRKVQRRTKPRVRRGLNQGQSAP